MLLVFKYLLLALCCLAILSDATQSSDDENQDDGNKEQQQKNLITSYFSKQANKNPTTRVPITFTPEQFDALINSLTTRQTSNSELSPYELNASSATLNKGKRPISSILDAHANKKQKAQDKLISATSLDTRGQANYVSFNQEQFNSLIASLKDSAVKKTDESPVEQNLGDENTGVRINLPTGLNKAKRPASSILDEHSKEKEKAKAKLVDTVKSTGQKQRQTTPSTSKSPSSKGKAKATGTSHVNARDTPSISYPKGKRPRYNEPTSKAEKSTIIKGLLDRLKEIQQDDLDKMVADKKRKQENEYTTYKNKLMFDDYKKHANNLEAYLRKAGNKKTFLNSNLSSVKSKTQTVKKTKPKPTPKSSPKPKTNLNPEPLATFPPFQLSPHLSGLQSEDLEPVIDARFLSTTKYSTTPVPSLQFSFPNPTTKKPQLVSLFSNTSIAGPRSTLAPRTFGGLSQFLKQQSSSLQPSSSSQPMNKYADTCGVCSDYLNGQFGDQTVITKYCKHSFHHQCLKASVLSQVSHPSPPLLLI